MSIARRDDGCFTNVNVQAPRGAWFFEGSIARRDGGAPGSLLAKETFDLVLDAFTFFFDVVLKVFARAFDEVFNLGSELLCGDFINLSKNCFHDFFGVGFVYLFPAGMALVFTLSMSPRPGMMEAHPRVTAYLAPSIGLCAPGLLLIFAGLPMVILSCLFFFDPEALAVSVTMANTSVGIALNNYALVWAGGAIGGLLLAYWSGNYAYTLLGPLAGYVAGASGFDVYLPWQAFIIGLIAPVVSFVIYEFTLKRGIDEHKLFPLFLGGAGTRFRFGLWFGFRLCFFRFRFFLRLFLFGLGLRFGLRFRFRLLRLRLRFGLLRLRKIRI